MQNGVIIHAYSDHLCTEYKRCVPTDTALSTYVSCYEQCPETTAGFYPAIIDQNRNEKSCFPIRCCDFIQPLTSVPDIKRYGDGTVVETADGDMRALYFTISMIADATCIGVTKFKLKEKTGDQALFDDAIANDEATGIITTTTNVKSFEETAYYEVYVDDNLVTNTPDFTIKNTKDFCFANNENKCSYSDTTGTTIY